jgi:hypothetical protein
VQTAALDELLAELCGSEPLLAQLPQCLEKIRGRGDFFDFILT